MSQRGVAAAALMPDFEIWQAMHAECSTASTCCFDLDVEFTEEEVRQLRALAKIAGMEVDVFLHKAVAESVKPFR